MVKKTVGSIRIELLQLLLKPTDPVLIRRQSAEILQALLNFKATLQVATPILCRHTRVHTEFRAGNGDVDLLLHIRHIARGRCLADFEAGSINRQRAPACLQSRRY